MEGFVLIVLMVAGALVLLGLFGMFLVVVELWLLSQTRQIRDAVFAACAAREVTK